jgi:hypothetical protein
LICILLILRELKVIIEDRMERVTGTKFFYPPASGKGDNRCKSRTLRADVRDHDGDVTVAGSMGNHSTAVTDTRNNEQ